MDFRLFRGYNSILFYNKLVLGGSSQIDPVVRIRPDLKAMKRPFGRGPTTRSLGDKNDHPGYEITTYPSHGMILQVGSHTCSSQGSNNPNVWSIEGLPLNSALFVHQGWLLCSSRWWEKLLTLGEKFSSNIGGVNIKNPHCHIVP